MTSMTHLPLRILAGGFNLLLVLFFIVATLTLYGVATSYFNAAGGVPEPSLDGIIQAATGGDVVTRAKFFGLSWIAGVAAAGCAWMSALGLRWFYHAIQRWV